MSVPEPDSAKSVAEKSAGKKRGPVKNFIRNTGRRISRSKFTATVAVWLLKRYFALVAKTSPHQRIPEDMYHEAEIDGPVIMAFWHGLHFMGPYGTPKSGDSAVLVSRNIDGEINACFLESLGVKTIRGSGGREPDRTGEKGALAALVKMSKTLKAGTHVGLTADIPKGVSRQCGLGIITLAKISGRPIVPITYASSRRKVFESAWDKAVLPLPFGRSIFMTADPIYVSRKADDGEMEAARLTVENELNRITCEAFEQVDRSTS